MGCAQSSEVATGSASARAAGRSKAGARAVRAPAFSTTTDAAIFIQRFWRRPPAQRRAAVDVQTIRELIVVKFHQIAFASRRVVHTRSAAALKMNKDASQATQLNGYKFTNRLGKGAYGEVYKAKSIASGGQEGVVAIKVIKRPKVIKRRAGPHPNARTAQLAPADNLKLEIESMKRLNHPNVVNLYEVVDDPTVANMYLIMEFVDGGTLAEPIEQKHIIPEAELRHWMRGLMLGLEHLHLNGVAHCDVKPENILMCSKSHEPKLAGGARSAVGSQPRHPHMPARFSSPRRPEPPTPHPIPPPPPPLPPRLWRLLSLQHVADRRRLHARHHRHARLLRA